MLKKLMLSAAAFSMVFVFIADDASARVNKSCTKCEHVRVAKARCPKVKCVKPHHQHCQSGCGTVAASSCSSCSGGSVSDMQHLVPVADPGPGHATPAPVEPAPAPSPSAAEPAK